MPSVYSNDFLLAYNAIALQVDRGLVISTADVGVLPVVPDATTNTKWQNYVWLRKGSTTTALYTWIAGFGDNIDPSSGQSLKRWFLVSPITTGAVNTITSDMIVSLDAAKLTGTLTVDRIADGSITNSKLATPPSSGGSGILVQRKDVYTKQALTTATNNNSPAGAGNINTQTYNNAISYILLAEPQGVDAGGNLGVLPLRSNYTSTNNTSTIVVEATILVGTVSANTGSNTGIVCLWNNSTTLVGVSAFTVTTELAPTTVLVRCVIPNTGTTSYSFSVTVNECVYNSGFSRQVAFAVNTCTIGFGTAGAAFTPNTITLDANYTMTAVAGNYQFSTNSSGYTISEYI